MKRVIIPIILLFMLATEGVAMELLPPSIKFSSVLIIPHWLLIFLILVAVSLYPNDSIVPILYATIFGLMVDIVYTGVLGVYMFMLATSVYAAQLLARIFQTNLFGIILITSISLLLMEVGLWAIYSMLGISTMAVSHFLVYRYLPTLLANVIFVIIVYFPSVRIFEWMHDGEIS